MNSEKSPEKTLKKPLLKSTIESTMNSFDKGIRGLGRRGYVTTPPAKRVFPKFSKSGSQEELDPKSKPESKEE